MPRKTAGTPLPEDFFHSRTALELAPALLGVHINIPAEDIVCRITETEAYMGAGDAACHASDGRRTARTEVMFRRGGIFYVYLIYGMYHCANIVSGKEGSGEAVLLRSWKYSKDTIRQACAATVNRTDNCPHTRKKICATARGNCVWRWASTNHSTVRRVHHPGFTYPQGTSYLHPK